MAKKATLFQNICKEVKKMNDFAFTMDEENPYEVSKWIDTGCLAFNAILSDGDIKKGFPKGKRIMLSGGEATAKSYLSILMLKKFLESEPNGNIVFFETEGSSTVDMAKKAGIPSDRMIIIPVCTVEDLRFQMVNIIDTINDAKYGYETRVSEKTGDAKKVKIKDFVPKSPEDEESFIFVVDSIGMIGTNKETNDTIAGKDKRDMTRAQLLKGFARLTSLKLSLAQIPMILINHVYSTMDMYSPEAVSGGSGLKYMADISLVIGKGKQKEGTEQIGVVLNLKTDKSRYMKENKSIKLILNFKKGLSKYSSVMELVDEFKLLSKEGHSYILPDGTKEKMSVVRSNPKCLFENESFMETFRQALMNDFKIGLADGEISDDTEISTVDDSENIETDGCLTI